MCGICGFLNLKDWSQARSYVSTMAGTLSHRGPDGRGIWSDNKGRVAFGHTRLSIIDLATGDQPMHSADGLFTVVFNGEIYNYRSLRAELEKMGHVFRTNSDTEVIIEAYRRWGRHSLSRLRGMFAIALYDRRYSRLFLARDRTGIKPLYYYDGAEGFFFGSELKAILAVPDVPRKLNYEALADYFVLGYSLHPKTFFSGIYEVVPGTWITVSEGKVVRGTYWRWHRDTADWKRPEAEERLTDALVRSISEHLESHVPLGMFLSGGIDSSVLAAILTKELGRNIDAFTVGFGDPKFDESAVARRIAEHLGLRHHQIRLNSGQADIDLVETVMAQFDQPFADTSAIPTYLISREIRKHVKVALSGDGGDEMFGGYPRYRIADWASRVGKMPGRALVGCEQALNLMEFPCPGLVRRGRRFLKAVAKDDDGRLVAICRYVDPDVLGSVLSSEVMERVGSYVPSFAMPGHEISDPGGEEFIDVDVRCTLPGKYLRKVDIASSAHGLEVRVPFLGELVLEKAVRLDKRFKYSLRKNKILLRAIAAKYLPEEIVNMPKRGFDIPLDDWLGPEGRDYAVSRLLSRNSHVRDLIRPELIEASATGFRNHRWNRARYSRSNVYHSIYMLWSLDLWMERWKPAL